MPKARRKKLPKIPDYTGISKDENKLIVQKSNPLQSLSKTTLSLSEFKILDAYLSKIDTHNPDKRYVRFEKGELEKILGVSRILKEDLSKRLDGLFTAVTIQDPNKPKGFIKIGLFAKAEANQDENGLWQVDLACTCEAMEYIFNIDNMGYLPYMLKNVIELTSRYSYILYLYLEKNRWRKTWKVSIEELKQMLNCTAETYTQYKRFNDLVLKKCYYELNEKTTMRFEYEPVDKRGRKWTAIKFTFVPASFNSDAEIQTSMELSGDELENLRLACDNEFSRAQIKLLHEFIANVPSRILPSEGKDIAARRYDYLRQIYLTMDATGSEKKNRFAYLKACIKNDISSAKSSEQNSSFDLDEFYTTAVKKSMEDNE